MLLVKCLCRICTWNVHEKQTWRQEALEWGRITYWRNILLRWLFCVWRKVSSAASCSYYWMLVQNNYLLAKNERTLTLQTYWIRAACLQAMSGVIQFCLRRTIYYERWVKKAPCLIAPQNHYRGAEGPWAAGGGTGQRWSRSPGEQMIQFASWAALQLRAISQHRAHSRTSAAPLIACAWRGNLHSHEEEARWLRLHLGEYFYIDKETRVVPKGKTQYWRCSTFLHLWC